MKLPPINKIVLSSIAILFTGINSVSASGFRIPEVTVAGLGTSNALVANSKEEGALPYNPAAMAFHKDNTLVAGLINVDPTLKVTPEGSPAAESQGEDSFLVPNAYFMGSLSDDWNWGLSLNAPFGLETVWPDETFGGFNATPISATATLDDLEPTQSKIEMLNLNPNFSYKINGNTSVALGLDYYKVNELVFSSAGVKVNGDGDGLGWNVAFLHINGNWSFGASYRSAVKTDLTGTVDATNAGSSTSGASATLEFPDMTQIGLRYQFTDALALEFDIERTGWSSFDRLQINHSSGFNSNNPITSVNNWETANAYRLGATYDVSGQLQLRFGYTKDETPQSDEFFSARVPDADRQLFSIGAAYDLGNWKIDGGYMKVIFDNRTINSTKTFGTDTSEVNGSSLYNGKYESEVDLFGIGVSTSF